MNKDQIKDGIGNTYKILEPNFSNGTNVIASLIRRIDTDKLYVLKQTIETEDPEKNKRHMEEINYQYKDTNKWKELNLVSQDFECIPVAGGINNGIISTFIKGPRAIDMVANETIFKWNSKEAKQLKDMVSELVNKGIFVSDLSPLNMIHDGKRWQVFDPGEIHTNLTPSDALNAYVNPTKKGKFRKHDYGLFQKWSFGIRRSKFTGEKQQELAHKSYKLINNYVLNTKKWSRHLESNNQETKTISEKKYVPFFSPINEVSSKITASNINSTNDESRTKKMTQNIGKEPRKNDFKKRLAPSI